MIVPGSKVLITRCLCSNCCNSDAVSPICIAQHIGRYGIVVSTCEARICILLHRMARYVWAEDPEVVLIEGTDRVRKVE